MIKTLFRKFDKNDFPGEQKKSEGEKKLLKICNKAIYSNPKNPVAYFNRGNLNFKLGNYMSALKDYNKAIRLNPKYLHAYHSRAITKEKLNYYNGAISDYNLILKIDSSDLLAHKNKNIILQKFIR
ncbi:tetratricopeptide repeat protein [uncultured Ilyobacter sp.]|uniref:tetratricopeptide repeat protein n=1 Tax=uncultured Ilyobacter sp. TaxID=544433 RepID=UPI002AA69827|nr:tetratricopeptide repeat protein [uncultured Ilyobacter sp.]